MANKVSNNHSGKVRIIGGQWRGRRLPVTDVSGLRPSSDRLRETLFNWLQPTLPGSRCLDLFAGTGALGIEAVSRGAAYSLLIEKNRTAVETLQASIALLNTDRIEVQRGDAIITCQQSPDATTPPFDLVLVDPPWALQCQQGVLDSLCANHWLAATARVYVEMQQSQHIQLPPQMHQIQRKKFGDAIALLLLYTAEKKA